MAVPEGIDFKIPSWVGKPPNGTHLDVMKGEKLIQKLIVDEKGCYFFGRNPKQCDFEILHSSCSRVHGALLYHKHLNRMFLVDLGSAHGTFIGKVRLEAHKPEQLLADQQFHFGDSSRSYILRERHQQGMSHENDENASSQTSAKLLGLPEREEELDNLTEYNTAQNGRRVGTMTVPEDDFGKPFRKRRSLGHVTFNEDEMVINPEDIDPNVGRFRNLVQTAVIPNKRQKFDPSLFATPDDHAHARAAHIAHGGLDHSQGSQNSGHMGAMSMKLGISLPNPAPDVDELYANVPHPTASTTSVTTHHIQQDDDVPKKKKYAKEAWPGKKQGHLLV